MSPFPFILALEGLNYMIWKANAYEWMKGCSAQTIRIQGNDMEFTHLFYADDSLVFMTQKWYKSDI